MDDSKLEKIISTLETKLRNRPNDARLIFRLLAMLDCQSPRVTGDSPYSRCQRALSAHYHANEGSLNGLTLDIFRDNYRNWKLILDEHELNNETIVPQICEGSEIQINDTPACCGKYKDLFNKTGVVPGICFKCFKVIILPSDLFSLIHIYFVLKNSFFERNNFRKCMVELREEFNYPYKGFIYCQSEDEALYCLQKIKTELKINGLSDTICEISHGCLEYSSKYPDFSYSAEGTHRSFEQPQYWQAIETDYLTKNTPPGPRILYHGNKEITVRDMICFETWIRYAETIGDESYKQLVGNRPVHRNMKMFTALVAKQAAQRNAQLVELRARQSQHE